MNKADWGWLEMYHGKKCMKLEPKLPWKHPYQGLDVQTWRVSPVWILTEAWYAKQGLRLSMLPGQGHKSKWRQQISVAEEKLPHTHIFQCCFPTLLQLKSAWAEAQDHLLNTLRGDLGHLSANFGLRVEAEVPATICLWPGLHWNWKEEKEWLKSGELFELGQKELWRDD